MKKIKILTVVGARPQFIKAAAMSRLLRKRFKEILVHTGQHYDAEMSSNFFKELNIPGPDYNLNVGSSPEPLQQVSKILTRLVKILKKEQPSLVIVYGDTNSTLAGALAASKCDIPLAHIEAGLRSYRRDMPEEVNRVLTDHLSTLLFCPTKNAVNNLKEEGIIKYVFNVGDIMFDALLFYFKKAQRKSKILSRLNLDKSSYYLATIHRTENADSKKKIKKVITILGSLKKTVIFPVHPRIDKSLKSFKINRSPFNIKFIRPVSYFDMLMLESNCLAILTDSGGVQREAYFLNVPCLTLRNETEWIETVRENENAIVGLNRDKCLKAISRITSKELTNKAELFGNGRAGYNILTILKRYL